MMSREIPGLRKASFSFRRNMFGSVASLVVNHLKEQKRVHGVCRFLVRGNKSQRRFAREWELACPLGTLTPSGRSCLGVGLS